MCFFNSWGQIAINTTGNAPDGSAALDIDWSGKGLLIPRISLTSSTDATTISSPATSLLVYNTNASMTGGQGVGYYYNAGTPASPNWVKFLVGKEAWLITGNDNITAPTSGYGTTINNNFIGTTNNIDFAIATNNYERFRIKSTDNQNLQIAIGSTSVVNYTGGNPSILQIHDWGTTTNDYSQLNISMSSTNTGRVGVINFAATQATNERRTAAIESNLTAYSGGNASGDLRFYTNNNNSVAERMRLTPEGYLGINTSTPSAYLDIQTPSSNGPFLGAKIYNNRAVTGNYALELNVASNALTNKILVLKGNGTEYASFRGNGRTIIGNTSDDPNTLLDIVGGTSGTTTRLFTVRSDYLANNTGTSLALINSTSETSDVGATITSILNDALNGYSDLFFSVHGGGGVYGGLLERFRIWRQGIQIPQTDTYAYINFNNTQGAGGYGFRDNNGTLEYKHSGGQWAAFAQPPTVPGNVEWWIRPTSALYIQPMYNSNIRVYDASQTYGFYFDGATNQYGGYFRTTGTYNPGSALSAFYDVSGNQSYTYLGCRNDYTIGGSTINRMGIYSYTDDPGTVPAFFRTTGNADYAANVNYSNKWIASYNYVDNASATYNPPALYSQLNVTNSSLNNWQIAVQGYSNRGTTAGNPGYTLGGHFTAVAQNQDAFGVTGVAYTNTSTRAGGYFEAFDFSGTSQAYAYVGTTVGLTARKITGTNAVSEIIPTKNHGRIMLTAPEAPEYWYFDYGTVEMKNGKAIIELDPILADIIVVNDEYPIRVFCTPISMPYFNGVTVIKRTNNTIELIELNDGNHSGMLDYQLVVKPKTNFGEGRFPQAPGPVGLKKEPPAAKAKNQPDPSKIFHWPSDPEVYDYTLPKAEPQKPIK
ncbi:MAG: hypothetical protein HPY79_07645 [Bacteroidales bacterium]|nr:hypothetical protein [Bacteroidales bacterium]